MQDWDLHITSRKKIFTLNLRELWNFKDLLLMFVKKDVITIYKQTILGPIWFFVQPIMTTLIFMFVFGNIANISTDGLPQSLFYLSGIVLWNYFSECFIQTSDTFLQNTEIFGKVYFPRIIIPVSKVFSGFIKFLIQFSLFLAIFFFHFISNDLISPNVNILLTPIIVLIIAGYGLGLGLIFSSLTSKYRDLKFLLQFGVQLLMFSTPIIYPLSTLDGNALIFMKLNPLTHLFEAFKYSFLGNGVLNYIGIIYSFSIMLIVLLIGTIFFNRTEKNFIDSI
tara:strand:+ start:287 stop:1126 length:840 start_codon:yes stop_codon:yes gene_type:complete